MPCISCERWRGDESLAAAPYVSAHSRKLRRPTFGTSRRATFLKGYPWFSPPRTCKLRRGGSRLAGRLAKRSETPTLAAAVVAISNHPTTTQSLAFDEAFGQVCARSWKFNIPQNGPCSLVMCPSLSDFASPRFVVMVSCVDRALARP